MKIKSILLSILVIGGLLASPSCKKEHLNQRTVKKLYKIYENGEISECQHKGKTVFIAGLNAYDAGSSVYDDKGEPIGSCNWAWGNIDPICGEAEDCEVVYRVADNIWGQPAVDKYGIGK